MSNIEKWIERAESIVGSGNVLTAFEDIEFFSHDEYAMEEFACMPAAAVRPGSEEETAAIVRLCAEMKIPLTARGGGTGLSAGCVPAARGVVLSLNRLNGVVDADPDNHTITVQAGMALHDLYQHVKEMNLFFPPHPGDEGAFIGGAVAANAGGARAVKYGTVKRYVIGLQVVLADGRIANLGGKFIKSSSGYNLLDLMIGSEGTLGIITGVTISLLPPPGVSKTLVVPFADVTEAISVVPKILKADIMPCAVEFLEHSVIRCAERLLDRSWPARDGAASLMLILDGRNEDEVLGQAEDLAAIVEAGGALDMLLAEDDSRQADILELRSMLYEALRPGTVELFDICVPRSEIAGHIGFIHELEVRYGISLPTYGHAADGNVHTHSLRCRLDDGIIGGDLPGWQEMHEQVRQDLFADAVARGGVISGEHGIGLAKRDYLKAMSPAANLDLMIAVKKALDPDNILNPGKVVLV
jgi:glycolate oxidase